jgi:hypothetical protein
MGQTPSACQVRSFPILLARIGFDKRIPGYVWFFRLENIFIW